MTQSPFSDSGRSHTVAGRFGERAYRRFPGVRFGQMNFLRLMTIRVRSRAKPGETQLQSAAIAFTYGERAKRRRPQDQRDRSAGHGNRVLLVEVVAGEAGHDRNPSLTTPVYG
jgi:hypothetical protein